MSTSTYANEECMFQFDDLHMSFPEASIKSEDYQDSEEKTLLGDVTPSEYSDSKASDDVDHTQLLVSSLNSFNALMSRLTSAFLFLSTPTQPRTWFAQISFSKWRECNSDILNGPWLSRAHGADALLDFLTRIEKSCPPLDDGLRAYDSVEQDKNKIRSLFREAEMEKNLFQQAYKALCKENDFSPEVPRDYNVYTPGRYGVARSSPYPRPPMIHFLGDLNEVGQFLHDIMTEGNHCTHGTENPNPPENTWPTEYSEQEYERLLDRTYYLRRKIVSLAGSQRQIAQYPLYKDPTLILIASEMTRLDTERRLCENRRESIIIHYLAGRRDRLERYDMIFNSISYWNNVSHS